MIRDEASYAAYRVGWRAVRFMPEPLAYRTFAQIADQIWRQQGSGVRQLERNLARVRPEATPDQLRQLSRQNMRSYLRYWCDAFRMPDWPTSRILGLQIHGREHLQAAVDAGRGVVVMCSHAGNYDHGAAFLATAYGSCTTVAERLKPERLFQEFVDFRAQRGVEVIPAGQAGATAVLQDRLRAGGIVALVGDRDLSRRGVRVDFFGEPTKMPAGPAVLSLRTGAALLPVGFGYGPQGTFATVFPPVDTGSASDDPVAVAAAVQAVADCLAVSINDHPQDWHMMQKLWLSDLDPARLARSESAG